MFNRGVFALLLSCFFVALNFYLFEGLSSQLISRYDQANRKEPRHALEGWQPIRKDLEELIEKRDLIITQKLQQIALKEASLQQEQNSEEPFEAQQQQKIKQLEEIIQKQGEILSKILGKVEEQVSLLNDLAVQGGKKASEPSVWNAKTLNVDNVVLGDATWVQTPLNVVLKTLTNPPFELVLELPLHGQAEGMINSTRGFIPVAAMIFKYLLAERCSKLEGEEKPLVVDVGANIGYLTGFGQALGCLVNSFEPYPSAFRVMRSMVKRNPNSANVFTYPQVVSSKGGFLSLQENDKWVFNRVKAKGNLLIATISLDETITPKRNVDLLKIDVEGHEMQVLKGASKLIENRVDNILIEFKKEGDIEERVNWLNSMIQNSKWKVYSFSEGYRPFEMERLYNEFDLIKHASRFVRLSSPIDEKTWIPAEDLWLTTKDTPFDF